MYRELFHLVWFAFAMAVVAYFVASTETAAFIALFSVGYLTVEAITAIVGIGSYKKKV